MQQKHRPYYNNYTNIKKKNILTVKSKKYTARILIFLSKNKKGYYIFIATVSIFHLLSFWMSLFYSMFANMKKRFGARIYCMDVLLPVPVLPIYLNSSTEPGLHRVVVGVIGPSFITCTGPLLSVIT